MQVRSFIHRVSLVAVAASLLGACNSDPASNGHFREYEEYEEEETMSCSGEDEHSEADPDEGDSEGDDESEDECVDDINDIAGMCGFLGDIEYDSPDSDGDDTYMICGDFAQEACDCLHGGLAIDAHTLRIKCANGDHHALNIMPCEPYCDPGGDLCVLEPQRFGDGENPFVGPNCNGPNVTDVASCYANEYCGGAGNVVEHEVYGDDPAEDPCVDFYPDADNDFCSYG